MGVSLGRASSSGLICSAIALMMRTCPPQYKGLTPQVPGATRGCNRRNQGLHACVASAASARGCRRVWSEESHRVLVALLGRHIAPEPLGDPTHLGGDAAALGVELVHVFDELCLGAIHIEQVVEVRGLAAAQRPRRRRVPAVGGGG